MTEFSFWAELKCLMFDNAGSQRLHVYFKTLPHCSSMGFLLCSSENC